MGPPDISGDTLWAVGDYDLAPTAWNDHDERLRAVMFWTQALRERCWREGLTLAEQPSASYTPPAELGPYYRRHDMGRIHLRARAWRRLDATDPSKGTS